MLGELTALIRELAGGGKAKRDDEAEERQAADRKKKQDRAEAARGSWDGRMAEAEEHDIGEDGWGGWGERQNESKKTRLQHQNAAKFWPEDFTGTKGCRPFGDLTGELESYVLALAPEVEAKEMLNWLRRADVRKITDEMIEDEAGAQAPLWQEISKAMGPMLHKISKLTARVKLRPISKSDGFTTYRTLARWFSAQSDADACTLHTRITNPARASTLDDLQSKES